MKRTSLAALALLSAWSPFVAADEPAPPKVTTVANGLNHPAGIAILPGTGAVMVAESGAGRIVRLEADGSVEVVGGLPTAASGTKGTRLGPLSVAFFERRFLAVGSAAAAAGKSPVRLYDVPTTADKIPADKLKHSAAPAPAADKKNSASGNIVGLASDGAGHLVVASGAADQAGRNWLGQIDLSGDKVSLIVPVLGTDGDQPRALTISPRGEWVTAEFAPGKPQGRTHLKFYNPESKKLVLRLDMGLRDVTGLAYSPRTGWLYATAAGSDSGADGGLFRLDRALVDGKPGVKAVLVTKLDRPNGLLFAPNGALYVSVLGKADAPAKEKPGKVVRLTGRM